MKSRWTLESTETELGGTRIGVDLLGFAQLLPITRSHGREIDRSARRIRSARELERDWRRRTEPADRRRADPTRHEDARGRPVMPMIEELPSTSSLSDTPPSGAPSAERCEARRRIDYTAQRTRARACDRASECARFADRRTRFHYVKQVRVARILCARTLGSFLRRQNGASTILAGTRTFSNTNYSGCYSSPSRCHYRGEANCRSDRNRSFFIFQSQRNRSCRESSRSRNVATR